MLVQLLQENPLRARIFHVQSDQHQAPPEPYTVLLRLLSREDWATQEMAAKILTAVIENRLKKSPAFANGILSGDSVSPSLAAAYGGPDPAEPCISSFIDWLISQLRRPSNPAKSVPLAASCLSALLKERGTRQLLYRSGGVEVLTPLLKACNSPTNSQLLYELCMCAWQMTYVKQAAELMGQSGIVPALIQVARSAQKEKVFRVAILSLKNLLSYEDLSLATDMVAAGLPKVVQTRLLQTWGDEDVKEMLLFLDEKLKEQVKLLTNFDLYRKEVVSGTLEWSPMHTSDAFWKENVGAFEDKDFQVLRMLLKLIESSREAKTVAVGCSDIGMFIKHHSQGRYIVNDLRGKELVMRHMANPDPEVQKQALLCVQKLMLSKDNVDILVRSG
jgi:V-type H+-transporting ATPase subunit H